MSEALKRIEAFKREVLESLLKQCTDEQQARFHLMYPDGVSDSQFKWAIGQCERTIEKNKAQEVRP